MALNPDALKLKLPDSVIYSSARPGVCRQGSRRAQRAFRTRWQLQIISSCTQLYHFHTDGPVPAAEQRLGGIFTNHTPRKNEWHIGMYSFMLTKKYDFDFGFIVYKKEIVLLKVNVWTLSRVWTEMKQNSRSHCFVLLDGRTCFVPGAAV